MQMKIPELQHKNLQIEKQRANELPGISERNSKGLEYKWN